MIEIKPHRWGWKVFEAPGVEPVSPEKNQAIGLGIHTLGSDITPGHGSRFVDFSQLTAVAVRTRHVFEFARKRAKQFTGVEPVRTVLFCDDWVGFGIARLYESLMENTLIEARVFRDLARAADWLSVPVHVSTLKDEPAPHIETTA